MRQLDELKQEVKKDFKSIMDGRVETYLKEIEEQIRQAFFTVHTTNPELSINANLSAITSVDITDIMERLEAERGDLKFRVLRDLGSHGYDVERTEVIVDTLVTPQVPAIVNSVNRIISPTQQKHSKTITYRLLLSF